MEEPGTVMDQEHRERREHPRCASSERIDIVLEDHSSFASESVCNISEGGVFVRTSAPWSPGTIFSFGLRPSSSRAPIRGTARVVWVRASEGGPDRPVGMGATFVELAEGSPASIRKMVAEASESDEPAEADVPMQDRLPLVLNDGVGDEEREPEPPRSKFPGQLVAAVVVLAALIVVLGWWLRGGDPDAPPTGVADGEAALDQLVENPQPMVASIEEADADQPAAEEVEDDRLSTALFGDEVRSDRVPSAPVSAAAKITNITWSAQGGVETVTVRGNGGFTSDAVDVTTLSDPPRCLVRIRGIREVFYRSRIPMTLSAADTVRIGHHYNLDPQELHLVFDLTSASVRANGPLINGDTFHIELLTD